MSPTNEDLLDILLCWLACGGGDGVDNYHARKLAEGLYVKDPSRAARRDSILASIRERNDRDNYVALFGEEKVKQAEKVLAIATGRFV